MSLLRFWRGDLAACSGGAGVARLAEPHRVMGSVAAVCGAPASGWGATADRVGGHVGGSGVGVGSGAQPSLVVGGAHAARPDVAFASFDLASHDVHYSLLEGMMPTVCFGRGRRRLMLPLLVVLCSVFTGCGLLDRQPAVGPVPAAESAPAEAAQPEEAAAGFEEAVGLVAEAAAGPPPVAAVYYTVTLEAGQHPGSDPRALMRQAGMPDYRVRLDVAHEPATGEWTARLVYDPHPDDSNAEQELVEQVVFLSGGGPGVTPRVLRPGGISRPRPLLTTSEDDQQLAALARQTPQTGLFLTGALAEDAAAGRLAARLLETAAAAGDAEPHPETAGGVRSPAVARQLAEAFEVDLKLGVSLLDETVCDTSEGAPDPRLPGLVCPDDLPSLVDAVFLFDTAGMLTGVRYGYNLETVMFGARVRTGLDVLLSADSVEHHTPPPSEQAPVDTEG